MADCDPRPAPLVYRNQNGEVGALLDRLIELRGGSPHAGFIRDILLTGLKLIDDGAPLLDVKVINAALKEMRYTAKVFAPYRQVRKVTMFGSARVTADHPAYRQAHRFAEVIAERGFMVITGAGGGIMEAGHLGAGPDRSFGVNIRLPFEQKANPVIQGNPRHILYKYFFNRKVAFLKEAHAVVLFPGGFGTLDEAMETLTLVQTGKRDPIPLVLVDEPGGTYWSRCLAFFERELLTHGYIGRTDFHLFERVQGIDQAVACIDRFYRRYHSLRHVGSKLVIRMVSELPEGSLATLKQRFRDLLRPGGDMVCSGPLPPEADEPELADLPRLVLDFNRQDFGRLRRLLDAVNSA